ncbi:hypothetical protein Q5H93_06430 [Hymenobacter sp. ASUV-10]|uniref:Uncharacterized protein n=1 Tax=Hymenobacter aranciens TaxID=3063996 RepID=A0ABT9BBG9_9BACT|nr:hypothetical protein [Hymenobacter sp. ASUV-10]MDO7874362.1 hypothetical protein [Hymenobacter sp. ASUV-10]
MRTSSIFFSLLTLGLLAGGCSSHPAPEDLCDCLSQSAEAYQAQHPDLTKAELARNGNEVMTALLTPCKAMGEAIEKQLKESDPAAYAKVQGDMQICLNTLAEKMKAAAKDDAPSAAEAAEQEADAALDAAEARADAAGGDETASSGDGVDPAEWRQLLRDYERVMTQYARAMKKAGTGDVAAGAEASDLLAQGQELGEQLQALEDELTPPQAAELAKLQARMTANSLR